MAKILITLVVPSLKAQYDLFIPELLTVGECLRLLSGALSDITQRRYISSGQEILLRYDREEYIMLDEDHYVSEYGFQHGDILYLF